MYVSSFIDKSGHRLDVSVRLFDEIPDRNDELGQFDMFSDAKLTDFLGFMENIASFLMVS